MRAMTLAVAVCCVGLLGAVIPEARGQSAGVFDWPLAQYLEKAGAQGGWVSWANQTGFLSCWMNASQPPSSFAAISISPTADPGDEAIQALLVEQTSAFTLVTGVAYKFLGVDDAGLTLQRSDVTATPETLDVLRRAARPMTGVPCLQSGLWSSAIRSFDGANAPTGAPLRLPVPQASVRLRFGAFLLPVKIAVSGTTLTLSAKP